VRKITLALLALVLVLVLGAFHADAGYSGSYGKMTIDGKTYYGVSRTINGKLMFFPDPNKNKGPCGADYCVYVFEDNNFANVTTTERDATITGQTTDETEVTTPDVLIEQARKGSPNVTFSFSDNPIDSQKNMGTRNVRTKITWTPPNSTSPTAAEFPASLNGNVQRQVLGEANSGVQGPITVTFNTDTRVESFKPSPSGRFQPFAVFDPGVRNLLGVGATKDASVKFDFFPPTLSLACGNYTIANDNEVPFSVEYMLEHQGQLNYTWYPRTAGIYSKTDFDKEVQNAIQGGSGVFKNSSINLDTRNGNGLSGLPSTNFILVLSGYLYVPQRTSYTFAIDSDDAADVLVDGQVVASFYGLHAAAGTPQAGSSVNLKSGYHTFQVRLHQASGAYVLKVYWKYGNMTNFDLIPSSYFFTGIGEKYFMTIDPQSTIQGQFTPSNGTHTIRAKFVNPYDPNDASLSSTARCTR